jgi:dihydrodipicolinate synthase/N-acetylneuraminate lyase
LWAFSAKVGAKSGGIARVKKARMEVMGQPVGPMRPPSLPLTQEELDELREIVRSWGWPVVESQAKEPVVV